MRITLPRLRRELWTMSKIESLVRAPRLPKFNLVLSSSDALLVISTLDIDKVSIELILNELVKENVLVNKKTSLGDSFRGINTPPNLVNSLDADSCPNNELTITKPIKSVESTADNNTPLTHVDIQTPLATNDNLSSLTKHSHKAFMNMEAKYSALKGYIDCEISILNSKVDQFIESLKETITKTEKRESSSIEILQENICFL